MLNQVSRVSWVLKIFFSKLSIKVGIWLSWVHLLKLSIKEGILSKLSIKDGILSKLSIKDGVLSKLSIKNGVLSIKLSIKNDLK